MPNFRFTNVLFTIECFHVDTYITAYRCTDVLVPTGKYLYYYHSLTSLIKIALKNKSCSGILNLHHPGNSLTDDVLTITPIQIEYKLRKSRPTLYAFMSIFTASNYFCN